MTGAKLPQGADSVIPVEYVNIEANIIKLNDDCKISKGNDVRFKGENIKHYEIAIKKNTVLTNQNLTLGAACGKSEYLVYSPMKIGIMTSGDELIDYTEYPSGDKVRATNSISLELLIRDSGMLPVQFGYVKDNKEEIRSNLEKALASDIDLLLTCGGVSVGNYDYVKDVLLEMGVKLIFWKVNIKPGKPLLFCTYESHGRTILILGLPGNPVSTFVGFNIFLKPLLKEKYYDVIQPYFKCTFLGEFKQDDGKKHFVTGYYSYDQNTKSYLVEKVKNRSSGNIANLGNSNCLIIVDENRTHVGKGEEVECIIL
jgi:molybdopterin molybdotransferase